MKTIGIVIPYFGKLPWYFEFFLHSCKNNKDVHFIFITDLETNGYALPDNLKVVNLTFTQVVNLIEKKMGFKISLYNPYKLCDFKPSYGFVFSDYLKGYDFWGYSDIDIIYGDIRNFIEDELLENYDIISVRPEYLTGFFALYRNNNKMNRLFFESQDYQYVFQQEEYCGFDECAELCFELMEGKELHHLPAKIFSMTHVIAQQVDNDGIKAHFDFLVIEGTPGNILYNNGKLIYASQYEILLYHLNWFKCHVGLEVPKWKTIPDSYNINECSFTEIGMS